MFSALLVICILELAKSKPTLNLTLRLPGIEHHSPNDNSSGTGFVGGWFLGGFSWTGDGTVSVVDREPPISYEARPAVFGPKIEDQVLGYAIPMNAFTEKCPSNETELVQFPGDADSNLGCKPLCYSGPNKPNVGEKWIGIVQRGECSFVEKVREAQLLGAIGVVVGGRDDDMINMFSPEGSEDITIPSTYIPLSSYTSLMHLIDTSNTTTSGIKTVSIVLSADYASWEWYSPLLTFALLLLLPSILTISTLLVHRYRASRARRLERAPVDIVHQLPWRVWGSEAWEKWTHHHPILQPGSDAPESRTQGTQPEDEELEGECSHPLPPQLREMEDAAQGSPLPDWFRLQTECPICLSDFQIGDRVRILPCNHIFHLTEVDEWLVQRKKLCPVCKADVTTTRAIPIPPDSEIEGEVDELAESESTLRHPSPPTETTPLLQQPGPQGS